MSGNKNAIWGAIGASNHSDNERESDDFYATDPIAIDKLLEVEHPNKRVWECACGKGHLSERLTQLGFDVHSTDIRDRGYEHFDGKLDFLTAQGTPFADHYFDILTNPPYKYAKEFVIKALDLLPNSCRCYMFLKLTFLEGKARYAELFKSSPPCKIYVFSKCVLCAKNGEFEKMRSDGGSAVAYAWFVWNKGYQGETMLGWI